MLRNYLFGAVNLAKNADSESILIPDLEFHLIHAQLSHFKKGSGEKVVILRADMNLSVHIDNLKKDISILSKGPMQGLDNTTLYPETKYSINFTGQGDKSLFKFTLQWKQQLVIC